MNSYGLMSLSREKEKIDQLVFDTGFEYLHDINLRSKFFLEEKAISSGYVDSYIHGFVSFSQAMTNLTKQYQRLNQNRIQLQMGSIKLYAIAQKERDATSLSKLSLKGVGFASGAFQILGGWILC